MGLIQINYNASVAELSIQFRFISRIRQGWRQIKHGLYWAWNTRFIPRGMREYLLDKNLTDEAILARISQWRSKTDPRIMMQQNSTLQCKHCGAVNWEGYQNCWLCNNPHGKKKYIGLFYKYGKRLVTFEQQRRIDDTNRGEGGIDLLQPTRHYNKSTKKWYTNPDYVRHWGDPFAGDTDSH